MKSGDGSSVRALSWRAPGLLSGSERCAGQSIALDLFDWWHFQRLGAHDQTLMQRLLRTPELVPVAFDLYGVLYKPQPVWRKDSPSLGSAMLHVLESAGELARIRQRTVLSEWATVMHLNALLAPMEEALQRGREGAQQQGRGGREGAQQQGRGEHGVAQDAAGLQATCEGASGMDAWAAARAHGGRAIHAAMNRYEQARAALEAFDRKHGLMGLPDQRGRKARRFQMRWGQRTLPPEPPWQRRGVSDELREQRDALVAAMRAQRERVHALQEAQRAVQARACEEIRAGQGDELRAALLQARAQVEEALGVVDEVVQSLCECDDYGRELGDVRRLPMDQFVRLSKVLRQTPSVRKIIELAGRWTELLKQRLSRGHSPRGRSELTGVTLGGGIEGLFASELVKLCRPGLRRALLAQVVERRALVQELRGPHVLGRGPVILVVDTSGSMSGARMVIAKSLMLALAMHCWEKRRPLRVLTFGAPGELHEIEVPVDEPFWGRFERCLELAFGGGTDFDGPLLRTCEIAGDKPWRQADAVFVTDGECDVAAATRAVLATTKARVDLQLIGILVGRGQGLRGIADVSFRIAGSNDWHGVNSDPSTWRVLECSDGQR
jgi:uncharacterized protein with von Willebrand factor type A (vWA) domain